MKTLILFLFLFTIKDGFTQNFSGELKSRITIVPVDSVRYIIKLSDLPIGTIYYNPKITIGPRIILKESILQLDSSFNLYSSKTGIYNYEETLIEQKKYYRDSNKVKTLDLRLLNTEDTFIAENDSIWKHMEKHKPKDTSMHAKGDIIKKIKYGTSLFVVERQNMETKKSELVTAYGGSEPYDIRFPYLYNNQDKLYEVKVWKRYFDEKIVNDEYQLKVLEEIKENYKELKNYANSLFEVWK